MKQKRKQGFMQGVLALMFSQVLIKLLGLFYKLYLTNKEGFGDNGNAIYSSGFQIYALLLTISSIGVPNAVAKLVSEKISLGDARGAHRIFKISFATFSIIGFIGSVLLFVGAPVIANQWLQIPEAELTLVSLSPSIFFVAIISVLRGYFNGRGSLEATANSQTLEQFFKTLLTIVFVEIVSMVVPVSGEIKTMVMAAGANLATTFATILSFAYLYQYYKIRRLEIGREMNHSVKSGYKSVAKIVKEILWVSIPMSLSSILTSINKNIDSMTVVRGLKNFLSSDEAKIQYGILSGKVDTLTTLPLSFNIAFATALVPAISSAIAIRDMRGAEKRISFSLLITILIGLPCTVGMILFAQPILDLLFPNASSGAWILQISSVAIIFTVIEQTVNGALQGMGKVMIPAIGLIIGVGVKLILNTILIPMNPEICIFGGVAGAALGTVVCHIIAVWISFIVLKKNISLKFSFSKFVFKPILITGMMGICSYSLYFMLKCIIIEKVATILTLLFAVLLYILLVFLFKIFDKEELFMIPYGEKIYQILGKMGIE